MPTLTGREAQIQAVAGRLLDLGRGGVDAAKRELWLDGDWCLTAADVARLNADGWTVETSAPLGNWIRHEGVVLTDAELDRAWRLAGEWQVG